MRQSSGRVGSADKSEGSSMFGVIECGDGIFEGIESISHSVVDVALNVGVSDKSMDDLCATHQIIISNTKPQLSSPYIPAYKSSHPFLLLMTLIKDSFTSIILFRSNISLFS